MQIDWIYEILTVCLGGSSWAISLKKNTVEYYEYIVSVVFYFIKILVVLDFWKMCKSNQQPDLRFEIYEIKVQF